MRKSLPAQLKPLLFSRSSSNAREGSLRDSRLRDFRGRALSETRIGGEGTAGEMSSDWISLCIARSHKIVGFSMHLSIFTFSWINIHERMNSEYPFYFWDHNTTSGYINARLRRLSYSWNGNSVSDIANFFYLFLFLFFLLRRYRYIYIYIYIARA
jgi:hypothetical protein